MATRYVPIMRWKRGEKIGLKNVLASSKARVFPIFELESDQFKLKAATSRQSALSAAEVVVKDVIECWGTSAPFGLFFKSAHSLTEIATVARSNNLKMIPVTTLHAPPSYQSAIIAIQNIDRRGIVLRISLNDAATVSTWMPSWPLHPSKIDLIIDIADQVSVVNGLGVIVDNLFKGLHKNYQWRSVTLSGTSMPQNFTGYVSGVHVIERLEFDLWQRLCAVGLASQLDYGDYTSTSIAPAPSSIAWGYPINVRYTIGRTFLICRGVRTVGSTGIPANVQLRGHANTILNTSGRGPITHCWADQRIDAIALGTEGPQTLEHWVRIGVNRHIEEIIRILP